MSRLPALCPVCREDRRAAGDPFCKRCEGRFRWLREPLPTPAAADWIARQAVAQARAADQRLVDARKARDILAGRKDRHTCSACGRAFQGLVLFSMHEFEGYEGRQVVLCRRCGGRATPTLPELLEMIARRRAAGAVLEEA